jgi:Divergent InlB B-repeat domain/Glucodextranase, domain B
MNVFKIIVPIVLAAILSGCPTTPKTGTDNPNTNTGTGGTITTFKLTVTKSGEGSVQGSGMDCGSTCSIDITKDDNVLLTATPGAGSSFSGWSGACSGTENCAVTMTTDRTVFANFKSDSGGGTTTDTTKPTVTVSSPATNQTVTGPNLTVTGTANDNNAVTSLEYSLNNAPRVSITPAQNYSFQVTLAAGSNTINVYAKDAAGNEGVSSLNVTYNAPDITNPTVSISSPGNGQTLTAATIRLIGSASDAGGIANIQYAANGGIRIDVGTAPNFEIALTLRPGANTITVYATDNAGNVGISSITVTYSPPSFTITPEQNVFFVGQKSVAFWKVNIAGRQNFNTSGAAFDSVTLENNPILGIGANKIQFNYRKTDSSQDEIVLEVGAGSSVPVGDYFMTVRATSGSIVKESAVTVRVAPCSLGCQ